jgi:F-type H+-transporting ATPase subunit a
MRLGCSTKIFIPLLVIFVALLIVGVLAGPIGSAFMPNNVFSSLGTSVPHVSLPAEPIAEVSFFTITNTLIASWITIILLVVFFYFCTRKMQLIPGGLQNFAEVVVETILNFISGVSGDRNAPKFLPIVGTIFLYIFTNSFMALLPIYNTIGFHEHDGLFLPLLRSANTDINVPITTALVAFCFIEYLGIREHGGGKYVASFFKIDPLTWGFKQLFKGKIVPFIKGLFMGIINIFIGLIEVLSHFIRLVSFSFRLFGNMTAGEILIMVITFLAAFVVPFIFYGLELFFGLIQAIIFAGLTLVFGTIALASHSEE